MYAGCSSFVRKQFKKWLTSDALCHNISHFAARGQHPHAELVHYQSLQTKIESRNDESRCLCRQWKACIKYMWCDTGVTRWIKLFGLNYSHRFPGAAQGLNEWLKLWSGDKKRAWLLWWRGEWVCLTFHSPFFFTFLMTSFIISAEEEKSSDISVSYTSQIWVIITSVQLNNNFNFSFYVNSIYHYSQLFTQKKLA